MKMGNEERERRAIAVEFAVEFVFRRAFLVACRRDYDSLILTFERLFYFCRA